MVGSSNAAVMRIKSVSLTVLIVTFLLMPLVFIEAVRFWFFNEELGAQLAEYYARPVLLQNLCDGCRFVLALLGLSPFVLAELGGCDQVVRGIPQWALFHVTGCSVCA